MYIRGSGCKNMFFHDKNLWHCYAECCGVKHNDVCTAQVQYTAVKEGWRKKTHSTSYELQRTVKMQKNVNADSNLSFAVYNPYRRGRLQV